MTDEATLDPIGDAGRLLAFDEERRSSKNHGLDLSHDRSSWGFWREEELVLPVRVTVRNSWVHPITILRWGGKATFNNRSLPLHASVEPVHVHELGATLLSWEVSFTPTRDELNGFRLRRDQISTINLDLQIDLACRVDDTQEDFDAGGRNDVIQGMILIHPDPDAETANSRSGE